MAAKWVQKIKDKLAANPLYYTRPAKTETQHLVNRLARIEGVKIDQCKCARCGGSGRKVPLYAVTNYGNEFNHCYTCGEVYR